MSYKEEFAKRLKGARQAANLTQEGLAGLIGSNQPTIAGYESGKRLPDAEIISKLAEKLKVSADYLCDSHSISSTISAEDWLKYLVTAIEHPIEYRTYGSFGQPPKNPDYISCKVNLDAKMDAHSNFANDSVSVVFSGPKIKEFFDAVNGAIAIKKKSNAAQVKDSVDLMLEGLITEYASLFKHGMMR